MAGGQPGLRLPGTPASAASALVLRVEAVDLDVAGAQPGGVPRPSVAALTLELGGCAGDEVDVEGHPAALIGTGLGARVGHDPQDPGLVDRAGVVELAAAMGAVEAVERGDRGVGAGDVGGDHAAGDPVRVAREHELGLKEHVVAEVPDRGPRVGDDDQLLALVQAGELDRVDHPLVGRGVLVLDHRDPRDVAAVRHPGALERRELGGVTGAEDRRAEAPLPLRDRAVGGVGADHEDVALARPRVPGAHDQLHEAAGGARRGLLADRRGAVERVGAVVVSVGQLLRAGRLLPAADRVAAAALARVRQVRPQLQVRGEVVWAPDALARRLEAGHGELYLAQALDAIAGPDRAELARRDAEHHPLAGPGPAADWNLLRVLPGVGAAA